MNASKKLNRRDFIKMSAVLAAAAAAPVALVPLVEASTGRFEETRLKMGTLVTLTVAGASQHLAGDAMHAAWNEMDRLIAVFDRHDEGTAVSELNAAGRLANPTPEMLDVLARAREVHDLSGGAFDPTVLPLLSLIEESFETRGRPPEDRDLKDALRLVDFGGVTFGPAGVNLGAQGRRISLDGAAKGYIVDRAGEVMRKAGVQNALINAGGDILAIGKPAPGRPWRIAVQDPFRPGKYARIVNLTDAAIATSGSYEIFFDKEQAYHHIMNPASGRPADALVSATVIAPKTALADALSTAGFVNPGLYRTGKIDGFTIARNKRQHMTPGFKEVVQRG